jgi:hypothetical protein
MTTAQQKRQAKGRCPMVSCRVEIYEINGVGQGQGDIQSFEEACRFGWLSILGIEGPRTTFSPRTQGGSGGARRPRSRVQGRARRVSRG